MTHHAERPALAAVVADDLSGAAEVAGLLLQRDRPCTVLLGVPASPRRDHEVTAAGTLVVDVGHRGAAPAAAHAAVTGAVAALAPGGVLAVKLDSLWRGNVGATVVALRDSGFGVVLAGALPALDRTVVGGVPLVGGVALAHTDLWHREPGPAPARVADLLPAGTPSRGLDLAAVRSPDLLPRLRAALATGACAVVDAETGADLAAVAAAAAALAAEGARVALAGSAALVAALADTTPAPGGAPVPAAPAGGVRPTAVVVGSGSRAAAGQTTHLLATAPDAALVLVDPDPHPRADPDPGTTADGLPPDAADPLVLSLGGVHPDSADAVARLADRAVACVQGRDLVLTGGETAHAVLTRLGVTALRPLAQLSHGAVVSLTEDGRLVATKPGSFGGDSELHDLVLLLRRLRAPATMAGREPQEDL